MIGDQITARAILKVRHDTAYDYDEKRGIWLYRKGEEEEVGNILTDVGRRLIHTLVYGTTAQKTSASAGIGLHFIGLSDDGTAPSASDTVLPAELSGNGLDRVEGAVALPTGAGVVTTVLNQFIYTGGANQTVQKTALFDAVSIGNMCHELLFTQRTLATSDTLTLTFSVTLT